METKSESLAYLREHPIYIIWTELDNTHFLQLCYKIEHNILE